ncbi:hypothetical protein K523DRAFT_81011 [Schizophyllum commune Tattone D]|nr:hypothetical protein K523DRAFT_81011 [Schizophyllum commune Tattone D]
MSCISVDYGPFSPGFCGNYFGPICGDHYSPFGVIDLLRSIHRLHEKGIVRYSCDRCER